jgi:hypothetical protein
MMDQIGNLSGRPVFGHVNACPYCGHKLTASTNAGRDIDPPDPGAFTICVYCAEFGVFDDNMKIRKLTATERILMNHDPAFKTLLAIQDRIRQEFGGSARRS